MAAAFKRLAQFSGFGFSKPFSFKSSLRSFSTNGGICDTSAITKGREGQGMPTKQAQAKTVGIAEVLENLQESLMQRTEMLQESNLAKFKADVQRSQMEMQREFEKLRNNMKERNSELRYAIHKAEISFKAEMEAAKYDVGKCYLGTIVLVCAYGFSFLRSINNSCTVVEEQEVEALTTQK